MAAKPWKYGGWIVTPASNIFGRCWRVELDPEVQPFPRTCRAMEIPCDSYRERAEVRNAILGDRSQAVTLERERSGSHR